MAEDSEERTSRIRKSITRTYFNKSIKIPKYESVEIKVGFEEDVSWATLEERAKKSDNITRLLKKDFQQTIDELFKNLKLVDKSTVVEKEVEQEISDKKGETLKSMELDGLGLEGE